MERKLGRRWAKWGRGKWRRWRPWKRWRLGFWGAGVEEGRAGRAGFSWAKEALYLSGDAYYEEMLLEMGRARWSVDMEVYTFEDGVLAERVCACFAGLVRRGVRVRLICDHWGSPGIGGGLLGRLEAAGVRVHLYRGLPWSAVALRSVGGGGRIGLWWRAFWERIRNVNRGFHRKVTVMDGRVAWVGSMNVTDAHLREVRGEEAWADVGVRVEGKEVSVFSEAFERAFYRRRKPRSGALARRVPVFFNDSFWLRRRMNAQLKRRIQRARKRIWIQNPYFLPERGLLRALCRSARRGVDVRIVVPEKNDLFVIRWMNFGLMAKLMKSGARLYEYRETFAHKKVLIVDDEYSVGSTNLNHRSFLHDLEVEVLLTREETRRALEASFLADQAVSRLIRPREMREKPWWYLMVNRILFFFRYWC
ncbi:MAG: hypothetical protein RLZZ142_2887 [Verrucomicrobiota bacterium]